jgi:uncharacterized protein (DUF1697 family)
VATSIVFLRGINVGKHRRVQMAALRKLLSDNGFGDVRTLLQSGNVVLESSLSGARLERKLEQQLEAEFGYQVDVFARTRAELAKIVRRNPLESVAADPAKYLVTFLREKLDAPVARRLRSLDLAPEELVVAGREIYSWHPAGLARSELVKHLSERSLGVTASGRNWRTVTRILDLADA